MGEREDKKRQTKPEVSMLVHEVVNDVRRYAGLSSNGEMARRIVLAALDDIRIINRLSPYLWKTYVRGDHRWLGHDNREDLDELLPDSWTESKRLPIRFQKEEWKRIDCLASALGRDKANTLAAILRLAIDSMQVLQKAAPGYAYSSPYSLKNGVWR